MRKVSTAESREDGERVGRYVLELEEIDPTHVAIVGGKGANLGALARIEAIRVPDGFCLTTDAFARLLAEALSLDDRLRRLSRLKPDERGPIRALSAEVRRIIEETPMPGDVAVAVAHALGRLGESAACAVRSSATAEDLPTASFAGQHDTYLNVVGPPSILRHVRRCWASLYTERAVTYCLRDAIDPRTVRMAVFVQRMVVPQAAGLLFTADPVTGNRKVVTVEATFGLGEALVSGLVNGDVHQVRGDEIVTRTLGTKRLAIDPAPEGGTVERAIEQKRREAAALTDAQVLHLARLGRRIEAHFGRPQDIEWCLVDGDFQFVQSRPITTLFPVPDRNDDEIHVYLSVGHQQMMTEAMKPLGISVWKLTAGRPMYEAGGRLFVDVTRALASRASRAALLDLAGRSDPLIADALQALCNRGDFLPTPPDEEPGVAPPTGAPAPTETDPTEMDPTIVDELIARTEASVAALKRDIRGKSGPALLDFILDDLEELRRILFDRTSHRAIMAGMEATWWLNDHLETWLGEKNAADTLSRSVPHNVTAEMGLALLDVADVIRRHPEVVAFLERVEGDGFLDELPALPGGREARGAIQGWLDRYGMRGVGEIDITRPRWSERPATLVPMILGNVRNFEPGAGPRRFEQGAREALQKKQDLLERLQGLPDGEAKAEEVERMIERVRTFAGYREYPKYGLVCRYFVYKRALLDEAGRLLRAGVLRDREGIFYLTFEELHEVVRTRQVDEALIRRRRDAFRSYRALTPARVLTSDGEVVAGSYRRENLPAGALVGLPVSAGTVEGRARVVLDVEKAILEPGDILVTTYTDPSWTPLFVAISGLVTEVGGVMTHGAVIAREYGLPAVVGVENATRLIRDGQRIRVHGTDGLVEILGGPGLAGEG